MITVKHAYDPAEASDNQRILVDRLWPRGISKETLHLTEWINEIAPSTELRKWFNHEPPKWEEFSRRYREELEQHPKEVEQLLSLARLGDVTLLYGAKEARYNNAVVLKSYLEEKL